MAEDLYKGKIISPAKAIDLIDEDFQYEVGGL